MYYHGTSDVFGISWKILPPESTGKLSETGRKKNLNKVFFTKDVKLALIYARKACKKFGGKPVLYRAIPFQNDIEVIDERDGASVYCAKDGVFCEKID